jgi:hypothetical protein
MVTKLQPEISIIAREQQADDLICSQNGSFSPKVQTLNR